MWHCLTWVTVYYIPDSLQRHTGVGAVVWPLWKGRAQKPCHQVTRQVQVRIIPQRGSKLPAEQWENTLCLDMSVLDAGAKAGALNTFKGQLHEHLQQLYAAANQGSRSADYFGVDIWKYFNDQVTTDILPDMTIRCWYSQTGILILKTKHIPCEEEPVYQYQVLSALGSADWEQKAKMTTWVYCLLRFLPIQTGWFAD